MVSICPPRLELCVEWRVYETDGRSKLLRCFYARCANKQHVSHTLQDSGLKLPSRDVTRPWTFISRSNENSLLGRELFKRPSFCTLALKM